MIKSTFSKIMVSFYKGLSAVGFIFLVGLFLLFSCSMPSHQAVTKRVKIPVSSTMEKAVTEKPILAIDTGGHKAVIRDVIFTKDGKYIVSAAEDKTIRVWDIETGQLTRTLRGQIGEGLEGKIYVAALSPDNRLLAVGGWMDSAVNYKLIDLGAIRLFDFQTGEVTTLLKGHTSIISDLAFSSDGRLLISASYDKTARMWDLRTGETVHELRGHTNYICAVALSPDGEISVTGSDDNSLKLWNVADGSLIATMSGHADKVKSAAFTPDGKYLLSGSWDKTIRLWNAKSGQFIKVLSRQDSNIDDLSISPDGRRVVTGHGCCKTNTPSHVFSIPSGERLTSFTKHDNIVLTTAISSDGTMAATGGGTDHEIYLWDINTGKVKQKIAGKGKNLWNVGFSRDGGSIAWGKTYDRSEYSMYQINGPLEQSFQIKNKRGRPALAPGKKLLGDSGYLRAIESMGSISIRTKDGEESPTLQILKNGREAFKITHDASTGDGHRSFTLTPDGKTVISGGGYGILISYSSQTGQAIHEFIGHTGDVWSVAVSPDGKRLISGSSDQTVKLWNIETGKPLLTIFYGTDREWVAWIPEGYFAASPGGDKYVGWVVNKGEAKRADYYSANQFRRYLYRPDIVNDTLALGSSQRALKKAGMEKITVADLIKRAPMDVRIASIKSLDLGQAVITIELAENKTTAPERITIYVNGAQMLSEPQRLLTGALPGDTLRYTIDIPYNETGGNHIKVLVENQWAETSDETVFQQKQWAQKDRARGTLYVTAVGVNRYPKLLQQNQLRSPGLDAKTMANQLKKLENRLYEKVEVNLIIDENRQNPINSQEIEDILRRQSQKAGPRDTSLIFLAGHGVTDSRGSYHFVTADTMINAIQGGNITLKGGSSFDWNRLHDILTTTMGKRVVIVDTCQAGEVLSGTTPDISKLVKDVHDVNAIIYSGTSRQQSGLETIQGGVFTQAIVTGLNGQARYDGINLLFTSLRKFVDVETPRLNQKIMNDNFRGIVQTQKEKNTKVTSQSELDFNDTQRPVAVIPKGMDGFIIYRR